MEVEIIQEKWRLLHLLGEFGGRDRVRECCEQAYKVVQDAGLQSPALRLPGGDGAAEVEELHGEIQEDMRPFAGQLKIIEHLCCDTSEKDQRQ